MVVKVDSTKCIGCGVCVSLCPEVFEIGSDGKSHVKNEKGNCDLEAAKNSCPVGAISI
ncbi:MAG: ferredoxin [Candidatus Diapherotrites archaeon]|nr:ferredoxin [Candidatus Diapherotrites archaeon]